ncbi:MAG: hypothetical protein R3Y27_04480 [Clostridia bacterium]
MELKHIIIALAAIVGILLLITVIQVVVKLSQKNAPSKAKKDKNPDVYQTGEQNQAFSNVYLHYMGKPLCNDDEITEEYLYNAINGICNYMDHRFDCSDFRAQLMFRIYADCKDKLTPAMKARIEKTMLGFKYFMDEPGDDSMCYWSENHQVLFAVSEYLAGQEWPDEIFTNSGMTGKEHMAKAQNRLENWMQQRFNFGFSEFLSNAYIAEDLAPMANFIQFCKDDALRTKMEMVMDILWFDIAVHTTDNRFTAASSRMYAGNKSTNYSGNSILTSMNALWGKDNLELAQNDETYSPEKLLYLIESGKKPFNHIALNFITLIESGAYVLPPVIKDIALMKTETVSKMSSGLSVQDMVDNDLIGQEPHQIMAQLGAETFTQPEVINNTIKYVVDKKMGANSFISYFKFFDLFILPKGVIKFAMKHLHMMTHGIALGRGNVYSYKNKDFVLTTTMASDVDECGTQDHIWNANIAENLNLYTTHPSRDDGKYKSSPGYWIGNGRRPMSVQDQSVNMTIYKIPKRIRPGEFKLSKVSHAYMPKCFYDEFEHNGNMVLARRDNVFVALISNGELKYRPFNEACAFPIFKGVEFTGELAKYALTSDFDLVREEGEYHAYITELSCADKETFEEFKARIAQNAVKFDGNSATYTTGGKTLYTDYSGNFTTNGEDINMNYSRYDNDFCKSERSDKELVIEKDGKKLTLNMEKASRVIAG